MSRLSEIDDHLGKLRAVKAAGGFFSEFWKFAAKGNAIQLAVAVVLGNAFGAIVNSLVADIITPVLSLLLKNTDISTWSYTLREPVVLSGTTTPALVIGYGKVIQYSINFFIIGLSIFVIFKLLQNVIHRFQRKEAEEPAEPISTQEKLLCEIRDILKEQQQTGEK